jgi:8-oxo-dGTP pyrophosphatase MutT (NUDIX family)
VSRRGGAQEIPRPAAVRPGRPAPWAHLPVERRTPTIDDVRDAMSTAPDPLSTDREHPGTRASAVLAAIYGTPDLAHVILTRRAQHLRNHRGEVSFPGGGQDPGEDLWRTALREAEEEVALESSLVTRLGELDHLRTITSESFIVPFVAELPGRPELVAAPGEVELVLHVSLAELLADGVYREEQWGIARQFRPIFFFEVEGDTIWGATAAMLRNFLTLVTGTFDPEDRPTPWSTPRLAPQSESGSISGSAQGSMATRSAAFTDRRDG